VLVLTSVAAWFRSTLVRALLILGPLLIALSMTVGTVLSPTLKAVLDGISPGQTFTGRTEIWDFAIDRIWERLYTGHGLEGFWGSDRVRFAEIDEGQTGIAQGMVHAHNSYVDAIVSMGLPGFAIVILTLVLLPFRDWMRAAQAPSNERMALLFARIWLFALYNACLETFFFRRADPVWFALLIAILGLRLVATWRIREA
jgi:O-antigen ligase